MKNISPLCEFSLKAEGGTNSVNRKCNPLRRSCVSRARNADESGESAICPGPGQPSAGIVRVECAKCRRECELSRSRATLCGDRVRVVPVAGNPLRRSCVSSARNAGESAICPVRAQPSAEIVRVECAKCRRECDLCPARATLCGDCAGRVRKLGSGASQPVTCKHTWSSLLSHSRRAMRPLAWEAWVAEAKVWLRLHPREDHRGVPREERQRSFPKRAAFALVTAAENLPGRDLGAQPCELCGQWTHSWCEACSQRRLHPVRCRSPCMSTMSASWAVVGSGPRCEYHTARLHRTQRLPLPDWQVCSGGPTAPHPTGGCVDRWHRCRPVGPDGRRGVSGGDNAVRVSPTQCVI